MDFNGLRKEALKWNRACFLSSEQQREGVNKMTVQSRLISLAIVNVFVGLVIKIKLG